MDDTYQSYINRVAPQTLAIAYEQQLANAQGSPKFDQGQPVPFPGFSLVTPIAAEDSTNPGFYQELEIVQKEVESILDKCFVPVPPASLHLTVADLIWAQAYVDQRRQDPDFEQKLCTCVQHAFADCQGQELSYSPCHWQVLGLWILPRSLGVVLVPQQKADYDPLMQVRRVVYQNSTLIGLGIEQQYLYTAHITLGYFDAAIEQVMDPQTLGQRLFQVNDRWLEKDPHTLVIDAIELRYFRDMTHFIRQPHYPVLKATSA